MTKNWKRTSDGKVMVHGKKYDMLVGSRRQVWNGTAYKTQPGKKHLTRKNLMQKKSGRIVSKRKSAQAKTKKNLGAYITLARRRKGKKFQKMTKSMVKGKRKKTSETKKRRRKRRR